MSSSEDKFIEIANKLKLNTIDKYNDVKNNCHYTMMITQIAIVDNFIRDKFLIHNKRVGNDNQLSISLNYTKLELYNNIRKLAICVLMYLSLKSKDLENQLQAEPLIHSYINEMIHMHIKKNADYSASFKFAGIIGLIIRLHDKINRFTNLNSLNKKPNYEPLTDSIQDMLGYSLLILVLLSEENLDEDGFLEIDNVD